MKIKILFLLCIFVAGCHSSSGVTSANMNTRETSAITSTDQIRQDKSDGNPPRLISDKCKNTKTLKTYSMSTSVIEDRFSQDGRPSQEEREKAQIVTAPGSDQPFYAQKWFPIEEIEKREILKPVRLAEGTYLDVLGCYRIESLQEQFKALNIYFYPALSEWIRELPHIPAFKYRSNNLPDEMATYATPESTLYTDENVTNMPITIGGPDVIYWTGPSTAMIEISLISSTASLEYYDIDKRLARLSDEWAKRNPPLGRYLERFRFAGVVGTAINPFGEHFYIILEMVIDHGSNGYSWTSSSFNNHLDTIGYIDASKPIEETPKWENLGALSELLIDMYGIKAWQKNVKLPIEVVEDDPVWADRFIKLYDQIANSWQKKGYIFPSQDGNGN